MASDCIISHAVKDAQERIFRIAGKRGLTLKAISLDSGIPYSTLRTYAGHNGPTAEMPVSVIRKLTGVVPDELLSLLLTEDRAIVRVPAEVDHDTLADAFADYLHSKNAAHHPDSPAGREIADCERDMLNGKVAYLPLAGKVAA